MVDGRQKTGEARKTPGEHADPGMQVAGVDEAGRGPWAGPVVAAAVIPGANLPTAVADSKRLTARERERLFELIVADCPAVSYWIASPRKIDERNVLQATLEAMRAAVESLPYRPDVVYVDGNRPIPGLELPQRLLVRGDGRCAAVAAASIVAKVVRDRMMNLWAKAYPHYGFHLHKGYGTRVHSAALAAYGPCPLHRFSFAPVRGASLFDDVFPPL